MVCDSTLHINHVFTAHVLILILLEYGLRQDLDDYKNIITHVLILILLEYGLRQIMKRQQAKELLPVLILILLEYGLRLLCVTCLCILV